MQLDMHYYGTYALARAAGFTKDASTIIATAAQFVDDCFGKEPIKFDNGAIIIQEETARKIVDDDNLVAKIQLTRWVPFHFLPGNVGESFTEKLVCLNEDQSEIVRSMKETNLAKIKSNVPYSLELLGLTAHVYADSFSHFGFSGVSSRKNKVDVDSIDKSNLDDETKNTLFEKYTILKNIKDAVVEMGALGHSIVDIYPDIPYLIWSFNYSLSPDKIQHRRNPDIFLKACRALFYMLKEAATSLPKFSSGRDIEFETIEEIIIKIINVKGGLDTRIGAWKLALASGGLSGEPNESVNEYADTLWYEELKQLKDTEDSSPALRLPLFRFYQAASFHRMNILHEILPQHGLLVV